MSFSQPQIDKLNNQRLADPNLKPELVDKVRELIALASSQGYSLLVTQGFRSVAQQNALYALGRTRPGKIVTNAKGGQSNHNFGRAVDFAFIVKGEVSWLPSLYAKLGKLAEQSGLDWGGNWKHFKDLPHVEIRAL
jgi:peptidoglycan L-alanyl-D-glutamate endopeptidase CwlK